MNIDASGLTKELSMDLGHGGGVMLYRCSFCKRGFSNAQALGGHMNIHRKDRAKLREFSDDNLFSLDITNTVVELDPEMKMVATSCEEASTSKHDSVRSLPLFAETPSISKGKSLEKNRVELIHGEIDLELRLGFQPHDAKINN